MAEIERDAHQTEGDPEDEDKGRAAGRAVRSPGRTRRRSSKLQTPSSKEIPGSKPHGDGCLLLFGAWDFSGAWSLEFEDFHHDPPALCVWLVRDNESSGTISSIGSCLSAASEASWMRTRTAVGRLVLPSDVSQVSSQLLPS